MSEVSRPAFSVAVFMGGPSGEHEISVKSGQGVVDALRRRNWAVEPAVLPKGVTVEASCDLVRRTIAARRPGVCFLALHGPFGEDGTVQQVCETLGVAYTGSDAKASRLGMDKIASRRRFEAAGLAVPRWQVLASPSTALRPPAGWVCPLVVKPAHQGSSLGVSLVRRDEEFAAAVAAAAAFDDPVLIEEFVAGRELTAGVLGARALPIVEIRPHQAFFDFSAKYTTGLTDYLVPALLPEAIAARVQTIGLTAHRALGCRHMSRTDVILRNDGVPVVLEVNTIPGFTPTSLLPKAAACADFSYDELCEQLVRMAWADGERGGARRRGATPQGQAGRPARRPARTA